MGTEHRGVRSQGCDEPVGCSLHVTGFDFAGRLQGHPGGPRRSKSLGVHPHLEPLPGNDRAERRGRRERRSIGVGGRLGRNGLERDPCRRTDRGDELFLLPLELVADIEEPGGRTLGEQFPQLGERRAESREA